MLRISNSVLYGNHFDNFKSNNKNTVPENIPKSNVKKKEIILGQKMVSNKPVVILTEPLNIRTGNIWRIWTCWFVEFQK